MITLFERQFLPFKDLDLPVNDPLVETLEQLNLNNGKELIRVERKGLRATQFVGVISAGKWVIQILPKIDFDPDGSTNAPVGSQELDSAANSAARNFLYLLVYARQLKLHHQTVVNLSTSHGNWLELLTSLFANELITQLRQGFHQDYVRIEELLPYVRGRWNIDRQFVRHPVLPNGLDVSYDDYSPDTLLNRVFRLAVERLQRITRDYSIRQKLSDLESWLLPALPISSISVEELDKILFNRLNERFQPAFELARLFLEGKTEQLLTGGQRAYAFVFDMDLLFQEFVANLLKTHSRRVLPTAFAECQIELQGSKSNKYLVDPPSPTEEAMFLLKPDILLRMNGIPRLIIDTKNKALPVHNPHQAVYQGDIYQMIAYSLRFKCQDVLLLYPRTYGASKPDPNCLKINESPIRIYIASLDLHQPLDRLDRLVRELHDALETIQTQEE